MKLGEGRRTQWDRRDVRECAIDRDHVVSQIASGLGQLHEATRRRGDDLVVQHVVTELVESTCRESDRLELACDRPWHVDSTARRSDVRLDRAVTPIEPALPK